ncbi:hypothetical protein ARMGADRAFT_1004980 [Armillaria gallica]|uniref:Uncharacterized protein n=1 Tax=Armillaria gallica TaxID=47427 RepID=A0A2H3EPK5_ARMGA|nr:hypothetical protein ARMGADRAFT_1004980 [Armillaria gallica]
MSPSRTALALIAIAAAAFMLFITTLVTRMHQRRARHLGWPGENCDSLPEMRLDESEARREGNVC